MNELDDSEIQQVLVLEDDPIFQTFYEMFFKKFPHITLHLTSTIHETNAFITSCEVVLDAAILDNQVDDGEGLTLLPSLKAKFPLIAVIMASGNEDYQFFLRAFSLGVDDYIRKPINMDLLWLKLKKSIKLLRLQHENTQQSLALTQWQQAQIIEQKLASHLMTAMLSQTQSENASVAAYVAPSTLFSGDSVVKVDGPDGSLYVMLADAMGHGLAAAVSLMPMVQAFSTMAKKGLPLQNIVFEVNRLLNDLLTNDRFVAAIFVHIQPDKNTLECWNGGMPCAWGLDPEGKLVTEFRSRNMALGVLPDSLFSATTEQCSISHCHSLFFCSDGLLESPNIQQMPFSIALLSQLLGPPDTLFDSVKAYIEHQITEVDDDISFVCVDLTSLRKGRVAPTMAVAPLHGQIKWHIQLSGSALREQNVSHRLTEMMQDLNLPIDRVQRLFTVLTELVANALEHGVLKLDSALKNVDNGFMLFYEEKERRLQSLTDDDQLDITVTYFYDQKKVEVSVVDSGQGFLEMSDHDESLVYGRGLTLLSKLCDEVSIVPPGNRVVATLDFS